MAPVPKPGRRKTAVLQERVSGRKPLSLNTDYPENLADVAGSIDFWLKSIKAFRWHDSQLDLVPDHSISRHAFAVMLGVDRDTRFMRHQFTRLSSVKSGRDSFPWREVRRTVCQTLAKAAIEEMMDLSFEVHGGNVRH